MFVLDQVHFIPKKLVCKKLAIFVRKYYGVLLAPKRTEKQTYTSGAII